MDNLEHERQRTSALEQMVATLLQRMDNLEHECQQLREMVMPQKSQSTSNNQASTISHIENSGEEQGGWVVEPMEVEENDPAKMNLRRNQTMNQPFDTCITNVFFSWPIY
jgi:hypothetical protein